MRRGLLYIASIVLLLAACESYDCTLYNHVGCYGAFYQDSASVSFDDTLTITAGKSGPVLLNKSVGTSRIDLPMSYWQDEDTLVLTVKGMDYLLQTCCKLKERHIPFCLKIAGAEEVEGQYLPQFSKVLGNQFVYAGIVSGESKNSLLRSLDVLAMPTFFEGLPMSLLECMSYGAVPVITPVGSIPTVVTDHQNGLFIKVKDTPSIVDAITYLHTDRDKLKLMSSAARNYIFEHFDSDSYIDKLNNIYSTYSCHFNSKR